MINVYIVSQPDYVNSELEIDGVIVSYYPEINVSFNDWETYYENTLPSVNAIVTQSSEILKFLEVSGLSCCVYVYHDGEYKLKPIGEARTALLEYYGSLMIKKYLFD